MLKQIYTTNHPRSTGQPFHLTPFEAKELNQIFTETDLGIQLVSDPERFQLVLCETVKVGAPVNRDDADYWIGQFDRPIVKALEAGERVGRVAVR